MSPESNVSPLRVALTRGVFVCLLLGLAGCQTPGQSVHQADVDEQSTAHMTNLVQQHEAKIQARPSFRVDGGLGIWSDQETIAARIDWQQQTQALILVLEGPMGIGTMQLQDDGMQARLLRGNTLLAQGDSADRVLQQGLGLAAPVPLSQLAYWIRGLPGAGEQIRRDTEGKLYSLGFTDDQGTRWQARFRRYAKWDGVDMPALITASGGPWSVRVVLKEWRYPETRAVPETRESHNRLPIPGR